MEDEEIKSLVDKINSWNFNVQQYHEMNAAQLGTEIREIIKFQQDIFQKIEEFESKGIHQDLIKYAKIICKNTTEREILKIQEIYLRKIETEFLKYNRK